MQGRWDSDGFKRIAVRSVRPESRIDWVNALPRVCVPSPLPREFGRRARLNSDHRSTLRLRSNSTLNPKRVAVGQSREVGFHTARLSQC